MLQIVVVVLKSAAGVIGRVDEDAFDLPAIEREQGFQRFKVVALNQKVVVRGFRRLGWRRFAKGKRRLLRSLEPVVAAFHC